MADELPGGSARVQTAPVPTPNQNYGAPLADPTLLTTQASEKAVANLKELLLSQVDALKELIVSRFSANDKAVTLLQDSAVQMPIMIQENVARLQELHEEKFRSIDKQFGERDTRTELATAASTKAIDAALSAQKEAAVEQNRSNEAKITKSETGFTKQIDQLLDLVRAGTKATDDKIDDMKSRLTIIESIKKGGSDSWATIAGVIGACAGLAAIVGLIIAMMATKGGVV